MNVQPQWIRSLSNHLRKAIIKKMPFLFWQIAYKDEREIELLPILCSREKTSIDVGANFGMFASFLIKNSKQCILFEPIPDLFTVEPSVCASQLQSAPARFIKPNRANKAAHAPIPTRLQHHRSFKFFGK